MANKEIVKKWIKALDANDLFRFAEVPDYAH